MLPDFHLEGVFGWAPVASVTLNIFTPVSVSCMGVWNIQSVLINLSDSENYMTAYYEGIREQHYISIEHDYQIKPVTEHEVVKSKEKKVAKNNPSESPSRPSS